MWQRQPGLCHQTRRGVDEWIRLVQGAGFVLEEAEVVRQPRFPWIYPIWLGIVPSVVVGLLARAEVLFNRHLCPLRTRRWQDVLFVFRRCVDAH